MNEYNLKRRRPYGHEDAPIESAFQGPPSIPSVPSAVSHTVCFKEDHVRVLQEASFILQCPLHQLIVLDRDSRSLPQPSSPASYYVPSKRQRLSPDLATMPPENPPLPRQSDREMPEYHDRIGDPDGGFSVSNYFTNFAVCPPCTSCDPSGYAGVPTATYGGNSAVRPPFCDDKAPMSQVIPGAMPPSMPPNVLESNGTSRIPTSISAYPALQASRHTTVQPTTRGESMLYPDFSFSQDYAGQPQQNPPTGSHVINSQSYGQPPYCIPRAPTFSGAAYQDSLPQGAAGAESGGQTQSLGIVLANQRPPQAKRGPFKTDDERQATAETRKIGSCIRCRMQRIRCQINPENKVGPCLTCQKVSNPKIWRLPCLRYKITDVKLFKPGQVKGHEWTRRWRDGVPDDIAHWASLETRMVRVTEGYTNRPVELQVREFVPQEGDALARSWVHEGKKKSVNIPPYAIVNLEEVKTAYDEYIKRGIWECCQVLLSHKEKILLGTYLAAMKHAADPSTSQKEKDLLKKALQLWMAIRLTTKSTVIVGDETLGMRRDIMDETSPLRGQIPLPPVMGAQIELVLIHQTQVGLRREMLENLQTMTQANKQQTWFTTYLVTFILLHNVSLLCQHDAGYARKHGFKSRFAREDMVREYQLGANILLAYFHYCNKGIYPFSPECREQDLSTLAELNKNKIKFVLLTRKAVEEHKRHWAKIRQSGDYENDFYYISQLYEQNWQPQTPV